MVWCDYFLPGRTFRQPSARAQSSRACNVLFMVHLSAKRSCYLVPPRDGLSRREGGGCSLQTGSGEIPLRRCGMRARLALNGLNRSDKDIMRCLLPSSVTSVTIPTVFREPFYSSCFRNQFTCNFGVLLFLLCVIVLCCSGSRFSGSIR